MVTATEVAWHLWRNRRQALAEIFCTLWFEPRMIPRRVWAVLRRKLAGHRVLRMYHGDLGKLPPPQVPPGYELRPYGPGLGAAWLRIVNETLDPIWTERRFTRRIIRSGNLIDGSLVFATSGQDPVATACALHDGSRVSKGALVYSVGVLPAHRRRGVGRSVVLAALHAARDRGYATAHLDTDTSSIGAIRLYLSLGFLPECRSPRDRHTWNVLLASLRGAAGATDAKASRRGASRRHR